jgi:hypothetical protein
MTTGLLADAVGMQVDQMPRCAAVRDPGRAARLPGRFVEKTGADELITVR